MRYGRIGFVCVVAFLWSVSWVSAAPRERRLLRSLFSPPAQVAEAALQVEERPYWSFTPEFYPQWYGGFHGRMLQDLGYPPGDLGPRGRAW